MEEKQYSRRGCFRAVTAGGLGAMEDTRALMGDNFWPYGVKANLKELELVMRYTHEHGLAKRRLRVEDIFHPSTLELMEA